MSWATNYSGTNNIDFDKPAKMSDTRFLTNWNAACEVNNNLKSQMNLNSNYDYRQYLIKNAQYIIDRNAMSARNNTSNTLLGDEPNYGYEASDLKNIYLSRKELQRKMVAPILTQEQYLIKKSCSQ